MSGKWGNPAYPQSDWRCVEVIDSGPDIFGFGDFSDLDDTNICEMCEVKEIRYLHVMEHDRLPGVLLEVGCICAGRMEDNPEKAKAREQRASRRFRFPRHKSWKQTENGNWRIHVDHHRIVVFRSGDGWHVMIKQRNPEAEPVWGRKTHPSERQAKLAAFDALIWMKDQTS